VVRYGPGIVGDLPKPNPYHTMQIGMHDHLQMWSVHFMMTHERLGKYNVIWLSVPAHHDLTPKLMSHEEVSQRNWKDMREMSQYLRGVVTQSLRGGGPAQRPIFNRTIQYKQGWLHFYMYARYTCHHDASIRYMEDSKRRFHTIKYVSLPGPKAKAKANFLRIELLKKRQVDKETDAES